MVPVLLASCAVVMGVVGYEHCGFPLGPQLLERRSLAGDGSQCVGLSTGGYHFYADFAADNRELAAKLEDIENRISRQNAEFEDDPQVPLTVAYLGDLTSDNDSTLESQLEQLRGVAVAQQQYKDSRHIRVLLANAGDDMQYAEFAAKKIKEEEANEKGSSLVAVLGLGISKKETGDAMRVLSNDEDPRIPMIGTFLSATSLATMNQYYHQVGPTNAREAVIAVHYVKEHLHATKMTVYYSGDRRDIYSTDLNAQMRHAMNDVDINGNSVSYRVGNSQGRDIESAGRDACNEGKNGRVVFYAGRPEVLPQFLQGMTAACASSEYRKIHIMAGDDASRFILKDGLQNYPGVSIDYLSFASSLALGKGCSDAYNTVGFYHQYDTLFGRNTACTDARDGSALLGYDTMSVFWQAIQNIATRRPVPAEVLRGIDDIKSGASGALSGGSGSIDYGDPFTPSVPASKAILVLRAQGNPDSTPPDLIVRCGKVAGLGDYGLKPCPK